MKNIILVDMPVDNNWELKKGIEETTKENWIIKYREGRLSTPRVKRILNFIFFPLSILLFSKADKIVAWQQFYGLMYCFYNRIFNTNKNVKVTIMTFIYKERKGFIGKLYKSFISFCINSKNINNIIVFSKNEVEYYSKIFPSNKNKFRFLPLGIPLIERENLKYNTELNEQNYIFTAGSSNRDYDFLVSALTGTHYKVKIACTGLNINHGENIEILHNVHGKEMLSYLYNCQIVIIPLKDLEISSGQLMLLQAMQLGKPIIVTNNKGIYDYIENGKTGFIINNTKDELLNKIDILYKKNELYNLMSQNEKHIYNIRFSTLALGRSLGKII